MRVKKGLKTRYAGDNFTLEPSYLLWSKMKPRLLQFILWICVSAAAYGQLRAQRETKLLSPAQQQEDYDLLQKALEEAHGGLYRYVGKHAMDVLFQVFRDELTKPATQPEFISTISEMLAEIHDGHTRLEYDLQTTADIAAAKVFPLQIVIRTDGVINTSKAFVLFNDSPTDRLIKPGMELISINGRSFTELYGEMVLRTPADGSIAVGKARRIERSFPTNYWLFIDQSSTFTVAVKGPNGTTINKTLDGILSTERGTHRNNNPVNEVALKNVSIPNSQVQNIMMDFTAGNIAILRIRSFGGGDFKQQLDTKFSEIKNKKAKAVVLDLRNNGGGVDNYGAFLVSQFMTKPFRYFDRIELTTINPSFTQFTQSTYDDLKRGTTPQPGDAPYFRNKFLVKEGLHAGVAEQRPAKNPFVGKLVVLINGGTFSTAADVTAILHYQKRATFVGQETGGGYNGNTSGTNAKVTLPNSGLSLRIQMYNYWNAVESKTRDRGTMPDLPIENTVDDLLKGVDQEMAKALEIINR
jgi:C-terminal processing protease CtpA/Prc